MNDKFDAYLISNYKFDAFVTYKELENLDCASLNFDIVADCDR